MSENWINLRVRAFVSYVTGSKNMNSIPYCGPANKSDSSTIRQEKEHFEPNGSVVHVSMSRLKILSQRFYQNTSGIFIFTLQRFKLLNNRPFNKAWTKLSIRVMTRYIKFIFHPFIQILFPKENCQTFPKNTILSRHVTVIPELISRTIVRPYLLGTDFTP